MIRVYFNRENEPMGYVQYDGRQMLMKPAAGEEKFFDKLAGQKITIHDANGVHSVGSEAGLDWLDALQHKFKSGYLNASPPENCG